jgi:FlgD Ig-like domain
VSLPRPRSLGDSVAPAHFAAVGTATWTLATPYSLGLASCQVTITRHGATVRKLSCAKASLASGVATTTWDGKTSKGAKAPAGTYHWTIHAAGKSGVATNSAGQSTPVTGTTVLSH